MFHTSFIPTTDVGFIYLCEIIELHAHFVLHIIADSAEHEPCGLLGNTDVFGKLNTAYTFLVRGEYKDCIKPLIQRNMAALEHCADRHCEPFTAFVSLIKTLKISIAIVQLVVLF